MEDAAQQPRAADMHLHHTALSGVELKRRPGVTDYGHRRRRRRRRRCELLTRAKHRRSGASAPTPP